MSKHISNEPCIETPALGRPFRLGMLYDRNKDAIIPGETIIPIRDMKDFIICEEDQMGSDYEVIYGDSLESKESIFSGDANLKLNVLKGTVKLGSSGKFLNDRKTSENKVRVSLRCNCFTHFKEIELKRQAASAETLASTSATHVVVAIKYGVNVTFVFERTVSESEKKQDVQGEMNGLIEKIPAVSLDGSGKVSWNDKEKQKATNVSCKFFGDLILPTNPTSYEEAVEYYKKLPTYIKKEEAVPVIVWLQPLCKFNTKEKKIEQSLNVKIISRIEETLEHLENIRLSSNDLLSKRISAVIPEIGNKLGRFKTNFQQIQENFQSSLFTILKSDNNSKEEEMLNNLITLPTYELQVRLAGAKREIDMLDIYVSHLENAGFSISDNLDVEGKLFEYDHVVILEIKLPLLDENLEEVNELQCKYEEDEPAEEELVQEKWDHAVNFRENRFLLYDRKQKSGISKIKQRNTSVDETKDRIVLQKRGVKWYKNDEVKQRLRKMIKGFKDVKDQSVYADVTLLVTISDKRYHDVQTCCTMTYYEEGEQKFQNFELPGPPGTPNITYSKNDCDNQIDIEWERPERGYDYVDRYEVSYVNDNDDSSTGSGSEGSIGSGSKESEDWETYCTVGKTEKFAIKNPVNHKSYRFKVRACSGHFFGKYSEIAEYTVAI